jgi:hypothetical protein
MTSKSRSVQIRISFLCVKSVVERTLQLLLMKSKSHYDEPVFQSVSITMLPHCNTRSLDPFDDSIPCKGPLLWVPSWNTFRTNAFKQLLMPSRDIYPILLRNHRLFPYFFSCCRCQFTPRRNRSSIPTLGLTPNPSLAFVISKVSTCWLCRNNRASTLGSPPNVKVEYTVSYIAIKTETSSIGILLLINGYLETLRKKDKNKHT